ncbi:MAG: alpha/beta hydrolase [Hyphomonadaceae bacterium]|nr:alpha/beta hydrolase [Hyphomonadaceae bacterium]
MHGDDASRAGSEAAFVDPGLAGFLDMLRTADQAPFNEISVSEARTRFRENAPALQVPAPAIAEVRRITLRGGACELSAKVYVPRRRPRSAGCVFFHGGGWVIGDADIYDPVASRLAAHADGVVVSVDYRLAPEHRFPAAFDDAVAAFGDVCARADELGLDPSRIAIAGESAGGNIAAAAANALASSAAPPRLQVLIYPATRLCWQSPSRIRFARDHFLTDEDIGYFEQSYLGDLTLADDPRASPLLAITPSSPAPAIIATAGFDPLLDQGVAYGERLEAAGAPATLLHYPDLIHGFALMTGVSPAARDALDEIGAAMGAALSS